MLALDPKTILALSPDILLRSIPDQGWYFAFDVASGDEFRLNGTSFWILEAISTGVAWTDLLAEFLAGFDVDPEQGEADLRAATSRLCEEGVVRRLSDGNQDD